MIQKENKVAGFFIRFLALAIDVIIFVAIGMASSLICISKHIYTFSDLETGITNQLNIYQINQPWTYYVWMIIIILTLTIQFIIIPFLLKGKTIGMVITKLKIKTLELDLSLKKVIWQRIQVGALLWIILVILFMIFINTKTINKINLFTFIQQHNFNDWSNVNKIELANTYKLSTLETSLFAIPATISSVILFGQLFCLISVGISKNKHGIIDKISNSIIVYEKQFIINKIEKIEIEDPIKEIKSIIVWKD